MYALGAVLVLTKQQVTEAGVWSPVQIQMCLSRVCNPTTVHPSPLDCPSGHHFLDGPHHGAAWPP